MAKGSQLLQLKAALNKAGITGNNKRGHKRKRSNADEGDKDKKAARLAEIQRKLNPFDVKVTKLKHDVGGRKLKGVKGKPAESKMAGIEQRKKTLLQEYEERGHSGGIVDRRIGENDASMSLEEKMLERFTRERQRAAKSSIFNLEDDEELTHYGQSLSQLDDFDNVGMQLDDEDEEEDASGQLDGEIVRKSHFSGFGDDDDEEGDEDGQSPRKKSKVEVMSEIIAKSKEHKVLRQVEREKGENIRHELDLAFDSLRDLLRVAPANADEPAVISDSDVVLVQEDTEYDEHVRELAFDQRAQPKDRTKTEEELALEQKKALEKAEQKRRKRMLGLEDDSDSEDEGNRKRRRGGDDLEDDFADGDDERDLDWAGVGPTLAESNVDEVGTDNNDEDEDDEDDEGESDSDESDSDSEEQAEDLIHQPSRPIRRSPKPHQDLPFTFPCPEDHDQFLQIVDEVDEKDVPTVVHRIRTLHHPSLAPDNKFKLQNLSSVLVDHILYLASLPESRMKTIQSLVPHLFELTESYPILVAEHFVKKLSLMHANLKRGLTRGALNPSSKTWPALPELTLLRVIGIIWPTSDMNHAVISPTRLLIAAYLGLGRVRSLRDVASGLFLCTLVLRHEQLSKRYVPEAVNYLVNTILHISPYNFKDASSVPGSFPSPDFGSCPELRLSDLPEDIELPRLSSILSCEPASEDGLKASLLALTFKLLGDFADLYKGLEGFVELYSPIGEILCSLELRRGLKIHLETLKEMLGRLLKFALQGRQPLQLQAHKAIPIPSYIPKFEMSSSSYLRKRDPDHERNEAAKLRYQYKEERKGAIRELRKDARFLAAVQQKKQAEKDRTYNERMKRVFGSIETERAEQKAMEREKSKAKKRVGRK